MPTTFGLGVVADVMLFYLWVYAAEAGGCTFSDAFLTFMPFLKVYSTYVNKHPSAIELLIKLQRSSSRFRKFLDECMNKTGMDVESYLILPIQRLPRYELILNVRHSVGAPLHTFPYP